MKLFVGSLPYSVNSDQLREMFAEFGEVETADVIMDRFTNQSKGFGFVVFPNDDHAKAAIDAMNDKEIDGRRLTVNEARPQENRERRPGGDRGGFSRDNNRY